MFTIRTGRPSAHTLKRMWPRQMSWYWAKKTSHKIRYSTSKKHSLFSCGSFFTMISTLVFKGNSCWITGCSNPPCKIQLLKNYCWIALSLFGFLRKKSSASAKNRRMTVHLWQQRRKRQLSYRKEDRVMRPIHGCPEKLPESSLRTRLLFPKFVMGFCSDRY